jgi:hypothetical protein
MQKTVIKDHFLQFKYLYYKFSQKPRKRNELQEITRLNHHPLNKYLIELNLVIVDGSTAPVDEVCLNFQSFGRLDIIIVDEEGN